MKEKPEAGEGDRLGVVGGAGRGGAELDRAGQGRAESDRAGGVEWCLRFLVEELTEIPLC